MSARSGRIFLQENPELFSESEGEFDENSDGDESENEESENEESENEESEPDLSNLEFKELETELSATGRPSKIRGAHNTMPRAKPIPESAFSSPTSLMNEVYGDKIWEEIAIGTKERAEKLEPESEFIVNATKMRILFGHLILIWAFKAASMEISEFFVLLRKNQETFDLQDFELLSYEEFNFLHKKLDIGTTKKVPNLANPERPDVLDLNEKLDPVISHFNNCNEKVMVPALDKPLAVDESLRASHSRSCQLRNFMPNKPAKFGEKTFLLVTADLVCMKLIFQFPKQFQTYNGTVDDLMDRIIPDKLKNQGYTIITDNYFCTLKQVLKMQKENTAVITTMRSNRIKSRFPKSTFLELTKKSGKKNFKRRVRVYNAKIGKKSNKHLQIHFYSDKVSKKPVIFCTNDPFLIQSSSNDPGNINASKYLTAKQKPAIVQIYNKHMGHVDIYDAQLKHYTLAQKVSHRRDKSQWLKKTASYFVDLFFLNTYSIWRKKFIENNPQRKNLPRRFHRKFQLEMAKGLLQKKESQTLSHLDFEPDPNPAKKRKFKRANCHFCPPKTRHSCSNVCVKCGEFVCKNHSDLICKFCFDKHSEN